ncbi:MAG: hypothetical protein KAR25_01605 [Methanosarcinales archaeon]|nr:hypothetical protein [Methanosarcinales archaeon]
MIEKSFGQNRYFERIVIAQTKPVCGMSGIAKIGSLATRMYARVPRGLPDDPGHSKEDQTAGRT